MISLRHLTQRITSCYTHKMAIVSWPQTLWRHFTLYISNQATESDVLVQLVTMLKPVCRMKQTFHRLLSPLTRLRTLDARDLHHGHRGPGCGSRDGRQLPPASLELFPTHKPDPVRHWSPASRWVRIIGVGRDDFKVSGFRADLGKLDFGGDQVSFGRWSVRFRRCCYAGIILHWRLDFTTARLLFLSFCQYNNCQSKNCKHYVVGWI